jgi:cathepsin A (carboxypeptidase C)
VGRLFSVALDSTGQTWLYVSALLERGIRVLNYAGKLASYGETAALRDCPRSLWRGKVELTTTSGTLDFICNHVGNEMWMNRLQWTGQEGFNEAEFVDFKVKGEVAGKYKTHGNLSVRDVTASRKDMWRGVVERQPPNGFVDSM